MILGAASRMKGMMHLKRIIWFSKSLGWNSGLQAFYSWDADSVSIRDLDVKFGNKSCLPYKPIPTEKHTWIWVYSALQYKRDSALDCVTYTEATDATKL